MNLINKHILSISHFTGSSAHQSRAQRTTRAEIILFVTAISHCTKLAKKCHFFDFKVDQEPICLKFTVSHKGCDNCGVSHRTPTNMPPIQICHSLDCNLTNINKRKNIMGILNCIIKLGGLCLI